MPIELQSPDGGKAKWERVRKGEYLLEVKLASGEEIYVTVEYDFGVSKCQKYWWPCWENGDAISISDGTGYHHATSAKRVAEKALWRMEREAE